MNYFCPNDNKPMSVGVSVIALTGVKKRFAICPDCKFELSSVQLDSIDRIRESELW